MGNMPLSREMIWRTSLLWLVQWRGSHSLRTIIVGVHLILLQAQRRLQRDHVAMLATYKGVIRSLLIHAGEKPLRSTERGSQQCRLGPGMLSPLLEWNPGASHAMVCLRFERWQVLLYLKPETARS